MIYTVRFLSPGAFLFAAVLTLSGLCPVIAAEAPQEGPPDVLERAKQLFEARSWDASELMYLKAADSREVERRIAAYEGLVSLYQKLRMPKKVSRTEALLNKEKDFLARLVPEDERYYVSYTVKKKDSYAKIARKAGVSPLWLRRANSGKVLKVGLVIRLPKMPYRLAVSKEEKKLYWMRGDGEVLKVYPVAVGKKETQTPEGWYKIIEKVEDPPWYKEHEIIPPGDPKNLLGTRWMGLDQKGYGIHGTRNPRSIGGAVSHGCIRMVNRDVEELFDWVPVGTEVAIQ